MRICSQCRKECTEITEEEQEHFEIRGTDIVHTFRYVVSYCCNQQIWESVSDLPENSFTEIEAALEEASFLVEDTKQSHCIISANGPLVYVINYDELTLLKYRNYKLLETINPC
jgi:hypothetical protein